jgi:hypothetical protein
VGVSDVPRHVSVAPKGEKLETFIGGLKQKTDVISYHVFIYGNYILFLRYLVPWKIVLIHNVVVD